MNLRRRSNTRDDQGVVAIELVLVMPFIIAVIVCIIALAGLFSTKSRVVGAARIHQSDFRARYPGITVTLDSPACPALTNPAYQTATPPTVTAKATKTYTVSVPFVGTWSNIAVTERTTMPCG